MSYLEGFGVAMVGERVMPKYVGNRDGDFDGSFVGCIKPSGVGMKVGSSDGIFVGVSVVGEYVSPYQVGPLEGAKVDGFEVVGRYVNPVYVGHREGNLVGCFVG